MENFGLADCQTETGNCKTNPRPCQSMSKCCQTQMPIEIDKQLFAYQFYQSECPSNEADGIGNHENAVDYPVLFFRPANAFLKFGRRMPNAERSIYRMVVATNSSQDDPAESWFVYFGFFHSRNLFGWNILIQ